MNNALAYALQAVYSNIPPPIIDLIFAAPDRYGIVQAPEEKIKQEVIYNRVLSDCDLLGGKIKPIALLSEYYEELQPTAVNYEFPDGIYRIPPHARDNVDIVAVLSVVIGNGVLNASNMSCPFQSEGNSVQRIEQQVIESHLGNNVPDLPIPELLPGNLIRLIPNIPAVSNLMVNCRLAYNRDLLNLNQSAFIPFSKLVVLATKAYIYNNSITTLETIAVQRGYDWGPIKDIIDGYSDANAEYEEERMHFRSGATLDQKTKAHLLSMMV